MRDSAQMRVLDLWNARIDVEDLATSVRASTPTTGNASSRASG